MSKNHSLINHYMALAQIAGRSLRYDYTVVEKNPKLAISFTNSHLQARAVMSTIGTNDLYYFTFTIIYDFRSPHWNYIDRKHKAGFASPVS